MKANYHMYSVISCISKNELELESVCVHQNNHMRFHHIHYSKFINECSQLNEISCYMMQFV